MVNKAPTECGPAKGNTERFQAIYIVMIGFMLASLLWSKTSLAANCDPTCQLDQINAYFAALDKISRSNSTTNDIDALLALTHDDVKYIHVEYGANFSKESWRKAFIRNIERGAYQNNASNEIRVLKAIYGKNHTAIEYAHGVIQANGKWQQTEPLLVVFGFTEGKISLIKELW